MNYNGRVITILAIILGGVFFIAGMLLQLWNEQNTTASLWGDVLANAGIGLMIPVVTLFLFKHIGKPTGSREIDRIFGKVSTNGKMGEKYWVKLIDQLPTTNEDVYFYGSRLHLWRTEKQYSDALYKQLDKRQRRSDVRNTVYFFLHDPEACSQWREKFREKGYTGIQTILIEGKNSYSIICCGDRISVTMRLHEGRTGDCPTLDIRRKSGPGRMFVEYLEKIRKNATQKQRAEA